MAKAYRQRLKGIGYTNGLKVRQGHNGKGLKAMVGEGDDYRLNTFINTFNKYF